MQILFPLSNTIIHFRTLFNLLFDHAQHNDDSGDSGPIPVLNDNAVPCKVMLAVCFC